MIRIIVSLSFLFISFSAFSQTTLLDQDFGTGSTAPTGWTLGGDVSVENAQNSTGYTGASGGSNILMTDDLDDGSVSFSNSLSTVGYTTLTVQWGAWSSDISAFPSITFEWNVGSGWTSVSYDDISSDNTWALVDESGAGTGRIPLPAGAEGASNLQLRWTFTAGESLEDYRIDDVSVQGSSTATQYYSKSTGNLEVLSNWGPNTDGTGTAPANFTGASTTYEIRNRTTATIGAAWTVSGASSKVITGDGTNATNFTIPSTLALTGTIDVSNNATLTIQNTTLPTLGIITNGTVDYAALGAQNVTATTYKNLTISGSGAKTLLGVSEVTGVLNLSAGTFVLPASAYTTLSGTISGSGTITGSSSARLEIKGTGGGNVGTVAFTSGSQELQRLEMERTGSGAAITLGSDLKVSLRMQLISGTVFLNGNKLTISEEIELSGGDFSGTSSSDLEFNTVDGSGSGDGIQDGGGGVVFASGGRNLNNLTLNIASTAADIFDLSTDLTIAGALALTDGTFEVNGNTLTINGSITGTTSNLVTTSSSSLSLNGSTAFSLPAAITSLTNFTVGNSASSGVTLNANLSVSGNALISSAGVLTAGTFLIEGAGNATVNGTVNTANTNGFNGTASTTFSSTLSSLTLGSSSTVNYNAAGGQTVTIPSGGYGDLTFSTSGTKTFSSGITPIRGVFTPAALADATTNSGTIEFSGSGSQTIPGINYHTLSSTGSGTPNRTLSGIIGIANQFNRGNETYTVGSSTVVYNGSSSQTVSTGSYNNLTLNNGSGASLGGSVTVEGDLALTSGQLTIGTNTLTLEGDITGAGALFGTDTGSKIVFNDSGGAPASTTLPAVTLQQLTINRTGNTVVLGGNVTVDNSTTITAGTLSLGSSNTLNVAGTITNNDFFLGGSGTVNFTGNTTIAGSNPMALTNATTSGNFSNLTGLAFTVSGNWTNSATISSNIAVDIDFNGTSGTQSIDPFTTTAQGFSGNLTFSGAAIKQLLDDLDANGNITISAGTLDANGENITVTGNWSQTAGTFTPGAGTVTFDGTTQSISSTSVFGNVTFSGSGTKTLGGSLDINGDAIINTTVTLAASAFDLNLAGDFTRNGTGVFTAGSGELIFDGTTQELSGGFAGTSALNDLTINSGSTLTNESGNSAITGVLVIDGTFDSDGAANGEEFRLISTASTDSRVGVSTGTVTGEVVAERYVASKTNEEWMNLGAPVTGATIADLQDDLSVTGSFTGASTPGPGENSGLSFSWYEPVATGVDNGWIAPTANTDVLASSGDPTSGFSIYMWGLDAGAITLDVPGNLNIGNVNYDINFDSPEGWNLESNPYYSDIDFFAASGWGDRSNLQATGGTFAVWDGANNQYVTVISPADGTIAMGQSFWVEAASAFTMTSNENVKVSSISAPLKTVPESMIKMVLTDGALEDPTYIILRDGASDNHDIHDFGKLANGIFNFSSYTSDGEEQSVNVISNEICSTSVKLEIDNINPGDYSFEVPTLSISDSEINVRLTDNFTGGSVLINQGDSYAFTVSADPASFGDTRFVLEISEFTNLEISNTTSSVCESTVSALFVLDSSQDGFTYDIRDLTGTSITTLTGTGSELSYEFTTELVAGEYQYEVYVNSPNCTPIKLTNDIAFDIYDYAENPAVVDGSICGPGSVALSATSSLDGAIFNWYETVDGVDVLFTSETGEYETPSLSATQSFYVEVENLNGCLSERVAINAEVYSIPEISSSSGVSVCDGSTGPFNLTAASNGVTGTYDWFASTDLTSPVFSSTDGVYVLEELTETSQYFVSFTNTNGCISQQVEVTAEVIENPIVSSEEQVSTCGSSEVVLSASSNITNAVYSWFGGVNGDELLQSSISSEFVIVGITSTTEYFVKVGNESGCNSELAPITVTVEPAPELISQVGGSKCSNSNEAITLTAQAGGEGVSYRWYASLDAVSPIHASSEGTLVINEILETTSYFVEFESAFGCISEKFEVVATVIQIETPIVSEVSEGILESSLDGTLQWYFNGNIIEGGTSKSLEASENGLYTVSFTEGECISTSEAFNFTVNEVTGIEDQISENLIQVYPNPASNSITINTSQLKTSNVNVLVLDNSGKIVEDTECKGVECKIDIKSYRSGIYFIKILSDDMEITHKFIKE